MAERWRGTGHIVRFIEYMDVGSTNGWRMDDVVPSAEVVRRISERWPLEPVGANYPGEVAERWRYADGAGEIGVISSVTQAFCATATRMRLSTEGSLYTCLFAQTGPRPEGAAARRRLGRRRCATRSRRSGARAPTATRRFAPPRRPRRAKSRCPTSVAKQPTAHQRGTARDLRGRGLQRARRDGADLDRRRASAHALPRQARDRHADDARPRARGARHRLPAQPAPGRLRIDDIAAVQVDWETIPSPSPRTRRKPTSKNDSARKPSPRGCGQGTVFGDLMEEIDEIKLRDDVSLDDTNLFVLLEKVRKHETIYKQAGAVHGCALATHGGRDPDVRRGRRPPQRGRRDRRLHVARRASTARTRCSTPPAGSLPRW